MTDSDEVREDPRTLWEARMDAKYAVAAHALTEHYLVNLNRVLVFLQIFFTSGSIVAMTKQDPRWTIVAGLLLAAVSAYQQSAKPLSEAAKHGNAKERFSLLVAKTHGMSIEKIDEQLTTIGAKAPHVPRSIQFAAYNDNLRTNGRPDAIVKESLPTRLIRVLA